MLIQAWRWAKWPTVIGVVAIATSDWTSTDTGGAAAFKQVAIPFHALASLWFAWFHEHATSLNDAAGDDEQLELNVWYRRDS
jgi:hypothetical protein